MQDILWSHAYRKYCFDVRQMHARLSDQSAVWAFYSVHDCVAAISFLHRKPEVLHSRHLCSFTQWQQLHCWFVCPLTQFFLLAVSPAERIRFILGEEDDGPPPPQLFTELDELLEVDGQEMEWKETARWAAKANVLAAYNPPPFHFKSYGKWLTIPWLEHNPL